MRRSVGALGVCFGSRRSRNRTRVTRAFGAIRGSRHLLGRPHWYRFAIDVSDGLGIHWMCVRRRCRVAPLPTVWEKWAEQNDETTIDGTGCPGDSQNTGVGRAWRDVGAARRPQRTSAVESPPTVTSVSPDRAYNYQEAGITITGVNFTATPTVTLGIIPVSDFTFVGSTTLTATVPPDLPGGVYTMTVTNPDN